MARLRLAARTRDDPAASRAFARACQSELKAAETAVRLKALEMEKPGFQIKLGALGQKNVGEVGIFVVRYFAADGVRRI